MNNQNTLIAILLAACVIIGAGMVIIHETPEKSADRDTMTQISVQPGLKAGDYYGSVSVNELLSHGNIGFGSFDKLNGEMIVLDGVCYQVIADDVGTVQVADGSTTVPFACVSYFDKDFGFELGSVSDIDVLKGKLDEQIVAHSDNYIYVGTIKGTFDTLQVRTEKAQEEPYKKLSEVLPDSERSYSHTNVSGTIVAVYFPSYMSVINSAGWHLHFISDDHKIGGHVEVVSFGNAVVELDKTTSFETLLPEGEFFQNADL